MFVRSHSGAPRHGYGESGPHPVGPQGYGILVGK